MQNKWYNVDSGRNNCIIAGAMSACGQSGTVTKVNLHKNTRSVGFQWVLRIVYKEIDIKT